MTLNETQKAKLDKFLSDQLMADTVYGVLLDSFLKDCAGDVQLLAAARLSIDFLRGGWKDLEKLRKGTSQKEERGGNPGV